MTTSTRCSAALIALCLLSGCSLVEPIQSTGAVASDVAIDMSDPLTVSNVDPDSSPAFLAVAQVDNDLLLHDLASKLWVDPASTRFQGEWQGYQIYLGVQGTNTVRIVYGIKGTEEEWGAASGHGNRVIGTGGDGASLTTRYLPQGTAVVPEGWTALSGFIIAK